VREIISTFVFILFFGLFSFLGYSQLQINPKILEEYAKIESYYNDSYSWSSSNRISYLNTLYEGAINWENDTFKAHYAEQLGVFYRDLDSTTLALQYLNESLSHSYDYRSISIALNSLGGLHRKNGDYESALDFYFKATKEAEKAKNGQETYSLGNISEIYALLKDYEKAVKYLKYANQNSLLLKSPEKEYSLVYDYSYLVEYYHYLNQKDSTEKYVQLTLENIALLDTVKGQKFMDAKFVGYYSLCDLYLKRENAELAKKYIAKLAASAQSYYFSTIQIFRARYEMLNKNYKKAAEILNSKKLQQDNYEKEKLLRLKASCYQSLGNLDEAIKLKNELIDFQNTKFSNAQAKFSSLANVKYETLKKNEQIESLKQEQEIKSLTIENQRYLVTIVSILFALLAGLSYFLWRQYEDRKKLNSYLQIQVAERTLELEKANQELKILNFIGSHDLKEPMRTVSSYVQLIEQQLPGELKIKFDIFFNFINRSLEHTHNLLESIASYYKSYEIENIVKSKVDLNQLVDDVIIGLDVLIKERNGQIHRGDFPNIFSNQSILYSILKNIFENAMKFNKSATPTVHLKYQLAGNKHLIIISDNGIGIEPAYQKIIVVLAWVYQQPNY